MSIDNVLRTDDSRFDDGPVEATVTLTTEIDLEPSSSARAALNNALNNAPDNAPAGTVERVLVILTLFVFYHQTPSAWFTLIEDFDDFSNPLGVFVQLGLIGIITMRVLGNFDLLINVIKLEPAVFCFIGLGMASVFWSADMEHSLRRSVMMASVTVFAAYLVMRYYLDEILELLAWMFTCSAVVNLGFILLYPGYGIDDKARWNGVFAQKNSLGYIAALAIPTVLIALRTRPKWRLVFYPTVAVHALLLWRSTSKTMLLVAVGSVCLIMVFQWFRARRTLRGAVILGFSGSAVLGLAFATANLALLADWLDKDVSLTGRVPMWEGLFPIAMERWLLGWGFEAAFVGPFPPVHEALILLNWNPGDSHNAALQIVLELGLVGLAIFLLAYFRGVSRGIKVLATTPGPAALWPLTILAITTLVSITESGVQSDAIGWCLFVTAVLSLGAAMRYSDATSAAPPSKTRTPGVGGRTGVRSGS